MKITIYNLVRTRIVDGYHHHNVVESSTYGSDLLDTLEHLYDHVLPARAEKRGEYHEGFDWVNDNRFEYVVYRVVDGVKTYTRTEVYEIVKSEVEVA